MSKNKPPQDRPLKYATAFLALVAIATFIPNGTKHDSEQPVAAPPVEQPAPLKSAKEMKQLRREYHVSQQNRRVNAAFDSLMSSPAEEVTRLKEAGPKLGYATELLRKLETVNVALQIKNYQDIDHPLGEDVLLEDLVPKATQTAIKDAKIKFTPISPVVCDTGYFPYYSPFDFSNQFNFHDSFKVDGDSVTAPIKTDQFATPREPVVEYPVEYMGDSKLNPISPNAYPDVIKDFFKYHGMSHIYYPEQPDDMYCHRLPTATKGVDIPY